MSKEVSLSSLSDEQKQALIQEFLDKNQGELIQLVAERITEYHSGPLPRAEDFEAYEKAAPGTAKAIVAMAKREQLFTWGHRYLVHGLRYAGMFFAGCLAVYSTHRGFNLLDAGKTGVGFTSLGVLISTIVGPFIGRAIIAKRASDRHRDPD